MDTRPATIAELKAAFPNEPHFVLDAAEKACTLLEAKAIFSDVLQLRNTELEAQYREALAATEAREAEAAQVAVAEARIKRGGLGVRPLQSVALEASPVSEYNGDPIAEFNRRVERVLSEPIARSEAALFCHVAPDRVTRAVASTYVASQDPNLHREFLFACNPGRHELVARLLSPPDGR